MVYEGNWLALWFIYECRREIIGNFDVYSCPAKTTQILLVTRHTDDQYLVHAWDGQGIFTFVDDGDERYAVIGI